NNKLLPSLRVKVFSSPSRGYPKATSSGRGFLLWHNKIAQGEGYYTEFIEKLGTGVTRIKQEVEKAELPEPVFHYNYFFAVEFTRVGKAQKSSQNIFVVVFLQSINIFLRQECGICYNYWFVNVKFLLKRFKCRYQGFGF
ncbi:hypothetical protein SAMN05444280_11390, partial [Tangfeifania diversioriginum]